MGYVKRLWRYKLTRATTFNALMWYFILWGDLSAFGDNYDSRISATITWFCLLGLIALADWCNDL